MPNKSLQTDNLRAVRLVVSLSLHCTTRRTAHKLRLSDALAENSMDPNNLKNKDVLIAVAPLIALVIGIFLLASGNKVFGLVLLVPTLLFYVYCLIKLPYQEIGKAEYENEQKQKQTFPGRVWVGIKHVLSYLSIFYVAILLLGLIYIAYSSLTSGRG